MATTDIEWTRKKKADGSYAKGRVWNPVTGCDKIGQGCKFCYAEIMHERFNGKGSFKVVKLKEDRLLQPLAWKGESFCFVNSVSDLFHEDVPFEYIDKVFAVMAIASNITFQVLTKRADRMYEYYSRPNLAARIMTEIDLIADDNEKLFDRCCKAAVDVLQNSWNDKPLLPNVWQGVSIEDQPNADKRIPLLLKCNVAIRFLSCEPLLGPVDLKLDELLYLRADKIHWVIVGGESGNKKGVRPMHPDWVRSLRDQCKAAGVAFFFKQWGSYRLIYMPHEQDNIKPLANNERWLNYAGGWGFHGESVWRVRKTHKKIAGNTLDGIQHLEYPIQNK